MTLAALVLNRVMVDICTCSLLHQKREVSYGSLFQVVDHAYKKTFCNGVWLLCNHAASVTCLFEVLVVQCEGHIENKENLRLD